MSQSTFLRRVVLKNYKSIAACDVTLGPLAFLVGPNGSGKSNFLDALRFVADALRRSLDHALRDRSGIKEVRRRSGGHPTHFAVRLEFRLPDGHVGHYAFRVGAVADVGYTVQMEECVVQTESFPVDRQHFLVRDGAVASCSVPTPPAAFADRLYLVNASGIPAFRGIYEALSGMGFYSLSPDRIRDLQSPDPGELLARDGGNLASVLGSMEKDAGSLKGRVEEYLSKVVPTVRGVCVKPVGPKETLEFRQEVAGSKDPWRFFAANMSDGTLRALGVLVALYQRGNGSGRRPTFVGIEEPEVALHPAAAGVLLDALREASLRTQIVVTSHSPDLLDNDSIESETLFAVENSGGGTRIAGLDEAGRTALHDRLYTPGELLRMNQLTPDPSAVPDPEGRQLKFFDEGHE